MLTAPERPAYSSSGRGQHDEDDKHCRHCHSQQLLHVLARLCLAAFWSPGTPSAHDSAASVAMPGWRPSTGRHWAAFPCIRNGCVLTVSPKGQGRVMRCAQRSINYLFPSISACNCAHPTRSLRLESKYSSSSSSYN